MPHFVNLANNSWLRSLPVLGDEPKTIIVLSGQFQIAF